MKPVLASFRAAEAPLLHCSGGLHNSLGSQKFPIFSCCGWFFCHPNPSRLQRHTCTALNWRRIALPRACPAAANGPRGGTQSHSIQRKLPLPHPRKINFPQTLLHCSRGVQILYLQPRPSCVTCPLEGGFKEYYCEGPDERSMSCRLRPPARRQPYLHALHSPPDRFEPC